MPIIIQPTILLLYNKKNDPTMILRITPIFTINDNHLPWISIPGIHQVCGKNDHSENSRVSLPPAHEGVVQQQASLSVASHFFTAHTKDTAPGNKARGGVPNEKTLLVYRRLPLLGSYCWSYTNRQAINRASGRASYKSKPASKPGSERVSEHAS